MKLHMAVGLAYLLIQTSINPATPQPEAPKASIEGTVFRSATGEPLIRAQVTLNRILPQVPPPPPGQPAPAATVPPAAIPQLLTESDGKFSFKGLDAGQYRLTVASNGYARQEYGQRTMFGSGTIFTLTAGQAMKDVAFRMVQNGTVAGRVMDSKGEPVAGLSVSLMRPLYNANGQRTLNSSSSTVTDDRGEYRLFWVTPGRYYVSVSSGSSSIAFLVLSNNVIADRVFSTTYYPGVTDPLRAAMIDIQPGRELDGIDVSMATSTTYRIHGKVVDASGQPPRSFGMQLIPRIEPGAPPPLATNLANNSYTTNPANGTFEVRNVTPGSYWLRATLSTNSDDPVPANIVATARTAIDLLDLVLGGTRATAQIPVDVSNSDVENANLALMPTISLPVRVSLDKIEMSQLGGMDRIRVNLRPTNPSLSSASQRSALNAEGAGTIDSVFPGEYRMAMSLGVQPDLYVQDARYGAKDALNEPFQITNQSTDILSIVLSNNAGRIDGTLLDNLSKPQSAIPVVLIPDDSRDRTELFRNVQTDQTGHFTMRGIPPGNYKLFAWEALENYSYFDRDVLVLKQAHREALVSG